MNDALNTDNTMKYITLAAVMLCSTWLLTADLNVLLIAAMM